MRWQSVKSAGKEYDLAVIGGGIVGLATARELLSRHRQVPTEAMQLFCIS